VVYPDDGELGPGLQQVCKPGGAAGGALGVKGCRSIMVHNSLDPPVHLREGH
jgi:hypothetical protein